MLLFQSIHRNARLEKPAPKAQPPQPLTSPLKLGHTSKSLFSGHDGFYRTPQTSPKPAQTHKPSVRFGSVESDLHVANVLQNMPEQDVQRLSAFFRILMASNETPIGYTMFGDKPMSFVEFDEVEDMGINKLYPTWAKYQRQIPSDNLCFRLERDDDDEEAIPSIFIINKSKFLKTVTRHLDQFQRVLGNDITPERLLASILSDESNILENKLKGSEELLGLLLGLTERDVQQHQLKRAQRSKQFVLLKDKGYEPSNNHNYRQVVLPQSISLDLGVPGSLALLRHWTRQQPMLQSIVDIPDDRQFLSVVLRKWADASTFKTFPQQHTAPKKRFNLEAALKPHSHNPFRPANS